MNTVKGDDAEYDYGNDATFHLPDTLLPARGVDGEGIGPSASAGSSTREFWDNEDSFNVQHSDDISLNAHNAHNAQRTLSSMPPSPRARSTRSFGSAPSPPQRLPSDRSLSSSLSLSPSPLAGLYRAVHGQDSGDSLEGYREEGDSESQMGSRLDGVRAGPGPGSAFITGIHADICAGAGVGIGAGAASTSASTSGAAESPKAGAETEVRAYPPLGRVVLDLWKCTAALAVYAPTGPARLVVAIVIELLYLTVYSL